MKDIQGNLFKIVITVLLDRVFKGLMGFNLQLFTGSFNVVNFVIDLGIFVLIYLIVNLLETLFMRLIKGKKS